MLQVREMVEVLGLRGVEVTHVCIELTYLRKITEYWEGQGQEKGYFCLQGALPGPGHRLCPAADLIESRQGRAIFEGNEAFPSALHGLRFKVGTQCLVGVH